MSENLNENKNNINCEEDVSSNDDIADVSEEIEVIDNTNEESCYTEKTDEESSSETITETDDEGTHENAYELSDDEKNEEAYDDESVNKEETDYIIDDEYKIKRIYSKKKTKFICISLAVLLILILVFTDIIPILPNAYNRFYVGNTYEIGETQGSVFDKIGKNVLYAGNGLIMSFGPDMTCTLKQDAPSGSPKIETSGNSAVVYYSESYDAVVLTDNSNVKKHKAANVITGATVNKNGYYGFITKEAGYKSYIEVYNNLGNVIYKYHTNNPIIDIAISDNGKSLVASSYELTEKEISGKLIFIDMTSDKTGKEVVVKSNLLSEVKFINQNTAVAFGDIFTVAYSPAGIEKWRINYKSRTLKNYDISSNGDIGFVFDRYSSELSESTVEVYGNNGNIKGIYESRNNIKYISANNGYFLLSLDKQTVLLDDEADVVKKKNTSDDFRKAVLYSNYNFAFSITDGVLEILSVKH